MNKRKQAMATIEYVKMADFAKAFWRTDDLNLLKMKLYNF